ncbi:MAG: nitroreductase [Burkholderiaceae bacterium]|nr:nitroreductase [Burkholderiaceae bacterium]
MARESSGKRERQERPDADAVPDLTLILSRHSVSPKRLRDPGPDDTQLASMLEAAGAAPDHELLQPWRFVRIPLRARGALAELFERALLARDPQASAQDIERAREKAFRAPELLLAIARLVPEHPDVPARERYVSLGCALMNLLLAAHALGFGAMLTGGKALLWDGFASAFALADGEEPVCFVSIGTPGTARRRARPGAAELLTTWVP